MRVVGALLAAAALLATSAHAASPSVSLSTSTATAVETDAFSLDVKGMISAISDAETSTANLLLTVTADTATGLDLSGCTNAAYSTTCTVTGSSSGAVPAGQVSSPSRTLTLTVTDENGDTATAAITLTILIKSTLTLGSTSTTAGTTTATIAFSTAVTAGFANSDLTVAGGACGTLTQVGGGTSYTSSCTADGSAATFSVSIADKTSGVTPAGIKGASAQTFTYAPEITSIAITDNSDTAINTPFIHTAAAIKVVYTFSGPMQGITTSALGATGSAGGSPTVASVAATVSNSVHTFSVTMHSTDPQTTFVFTLTAPTVDAVMASGVTNSVFCKFDETAPVVTVKQEPFVLADNAVGTMDVLSTVINTLTDDVTAQADLTLSLAITGASGKLTSSCAGAYSAGCTVTGAGTGGLVPADSVAAYAAALTITDQASRATTLNFKVVVRATISADTAMAAKATKTGMFAPFGDPVGTTRTVAETFDNVCTSSSGASGIAVDLAVSDTSGSQASQCTVSNSGNTQGAVNKPTLSCAFNAAGVVAVSVTCKDEWGNVTAGEKDVQHVTTGSWSIAANTPPAVTATGSFAYTENGVARKIGEDITVDITDSEDTTLTQVVVSLVGCSGSGNNHKLGTHTDMPAAISATVSSNKCMVTLAPASGSSSTIANFKSAVNAVTFSSLSDNPNATEGVTVLINATDAAGGEASMPPMYYLTGSKTFNFAIVDVNDQVAVLVGTAAGSANTTAFSPTATTIKITENPAAGACIKMADGNDLVITIEDVDAIQTTIHGRKSNFADDLDIKLEILHYNSTLVTDQTADASAPDTEFFTLVNTTGVLSSSTSQALDTNTVGGTSEHYVYKKYKICVAAFNANTTANHQRKSWRTIDYENNHPSKYSAYTASKTLPLRLRATSPRNLNAKEFVIWYNVEDVANEAPHFFHVTEGTVGTEGVRTGSLGMQNPRNYYRSSLTSTYTYRTGNLEASTGNIVVDSVSVNFYDTSKHTGVFYSGIMRPIDFVHGVQNEIGFETANVVVDADGAPTLQPRVYLEYMGEVTKTTAPSGSAINPTIKVWPGNTSTLGGIFSSATGKLFQFTQNSTHLAFSGTPAYDQLTLLNYTFASSKRATPEAKRLYFKVHALHPTLDSLESITHMYLDIEVRGCMDVRGSYTNGTTFLSTSSSLVFPSAANLAQYNNSAPWKNLEGNFNPNASIPSLCTFPPRQVPAGAAATFSIKGARTEETAAALETALGSTPTDAQLESARGYVALDVPTGATTAAVPLEVAGVTEDVALAVPPPKDGAIVQADLSVKLGPCGQQFEKPIEVCVFVGKETPGRFYTMYHASAVSCGDTSLGYGEFQPTTGNSYNAATGKLCGKVSSFSIVSGVSLPTPVSSQLDNRFFVMGGGCPNECSSHGYCRAYGKCFCFEGFSGFDCSKRTCPFGESWAADSEVPRQAAECSGRGECDRSSGECACQDGFEGPACERMSCENDCNGHGKCRYISELTNPSGASYSEWDASRIQACECDPGYFGSDCSLRYCPYGDDPQTHCDASANKIQTVEIKVPLSAAEAGASNFPETGLTTSWQVDYASLVLVWTDAAGNSFSTTPVHDLLTTKSGTALTVSALQTAVSTALKNLPNFVAGDDAQITASAVDAETRTITVNMAGEQNSGDTLSITCPTTYGCPSAGCRPRYQQPRLHAAKVAAANQVSVVEPVYVTTSVGIKVTIASGPNPGASYKTYQIETCPITVSGNTPTLGTCTVTTSARPVPTRNRATKTIDAGSGVVIRFDAASPTDGSYNFYYIVGSCTASTTRRAGASREGIECAGRGTCDRTAGTCDCFEGYQGFNCATRSIII